MHKNVFAFTLTKNDLPTTYTIFKARSLFSRNFKYKKEGRKIVFFFVFKDFTFSL